MKYLFLKINKFIGNYLLKTPFYILFFNLRSNILKTNNKIRKSNEFIEIINKNFFYVHLARSDYYIKGIERRFEKLRNEYFLDFIIKFKCRSLIDIGANIGEVPLSIIKNLNGIKYIGIEPSPDEFKCLSKNLSINMDEYKVLNNVCGEINNVNLEFYLSSEQADSSVIKPDHNSKKIILKQTTIDTLIEKYDLTNVFIKIDTEGYEPETIKGMKRQINKVNFISVDCGFERGLEKLSTLPVVTSILYEKGFEMIKNNKKRMTFLFKNKNI